MGSDNKERSLASSSWLVDRMEDLVDIIHRSSNTRDRGSSQCPPRSAEEMRRDALQV